MPMTIRKPDTKDVDTLVDFNKSMAKETEGKTLDRATLTAGVEAVSLR